MIEYRHDGEVVTRLAAARLLNIVGGHPVKITAIAEPGSALETGWEVIVYARMLKFGGVRPPEVAWSTFGGVCADEARAYISLIALGADLCDLSAEFLAEPGAVLTDNAAQAEREAQDR